MNVLRPHEPVLNNTGYGILPGHIATKGSISSLPKADQFPDKIIYLWQESFALAACPFSTRMALIDSSRWSDRKSKNRYFQRGIKRSCRPAVARLAQQSQASPHHPHAGIAGETSKAQHPEVFLSKSRHPAGGSYIVTDS